MTFSQLRTIPWRIFQLLITLLGMFCSFVAEAFDVANARLIDMYYYISVNKLAK